LDHDIVGRAALFVRYRAATLRPAFAAQRRLEPMALWSWPLMKWLEHSGSGPALFLMAGEYHRFAMLSIEPGLKDWYPQAALWVIRLFRRL